MASQTEVRADFQGLYTAVSPGLAPPGGMIEATNVVFRTPRQAESRPGFRVGGVLAATALGRVEFPIDDNQAGLAILSNGDTVWDGFGETGTVTQEDGSTDLTWEDYSGVVARRSLYILTADALRAVHEVDAAVAYRAGVPQPAVTEANVSTAVDTGPAFEADGYRAYRAVCRRGQESTGASHIARSAPSNRLVVYAAAGENVTLTVAIHAADDWHEGDVIELYSSEESTTFPTDELYLNQEVAVTATHITAGGLTILDDTPDADLGAALYTNESREGAEGGHYRPPVAGCATVFNNSLWLGDLRYPASLEVSAKQVLNGTADAADLIGRHTVTGTFTNGSAVITGVADTSKIKVGMILFRSTGGYPDDWSGTGQIRVTAVTTNTSVTVSQTWTGATGAETPFFEDSIRVGSEYYPTRYFVDAVRGNSTHSLAAQLGMAESALYDGEWLSDTRVNTGFADQQVFRLRLFALLASTTAPEVWATNGDQYTPALPEPSVANGYQMPQEILPDHVAWSKQDEPEHFPLTNIERVGDGGARVLCLAPTRGAVLIATDRGTWRGYGYADSSVSFDDYDPNLRPLGRRCAAAVGPYQYIAADTGVYECDEHKAVDLTTDRLNDMDALFRAIRPERVSSVKVVSNDKHDEVLVCCPSASSITGNVVEHFVYHVRQRAWSRWVLPSESKDLTVKGPERRLVTCDATAAGSYLENLETDTGLYADAQHNVTVNSVTSRTVTIAAASGWTPEAGDALYQASVAYVVTDVTSATVFDVHAAGVAAGAAVAYEAIECTLTPTVNTLKAGHTMKVWGEGSLWWTLRQGVAAYFLGFRGPYSSYAEHERVIADAPPTTSSNTTVPVATKFAVPRNAARATHVTLTLRIRQALSRWAVEAVTIKARVTGDRPPNRFA